MRTLITVAFALRIALGVAGCAPKVRVLTLCEAVGNWKAYHGQRVRLRANLGVGPETRVLYDPACKAGKALTSVSYVSDDVVAAGEGKKLVAILRRDRAARVVLEGVFYGPEPIRADPKWPDPLKRLVDGTPRGYGHMGMFETAFKVSTVLEAATVPTAER